MLRGKCLRGIRIGRRQRVGLARSLGSADGSLIADLLQVSSQLRYQHPYQLIINHQSSTKPRTSIRR